MFAITVPRSDVFQYDATTSAGVRAKAHSTNGHVLNTIRGIRYIIVQYARRPCDSNWFLFSLRRRNRAPRHYARGRLNALTRDFAMSHWRRRHHHEPRLIDCDWKCRGKSGFVKLKSEKTSSKTTSKTTDEKKKKKLDEIMAMWSSSYFPSLLCVPRTR